MTNEISLRQVQQSDLPIFFAQQLDPEATSMAAFPSRGRQEFMAHWRKILVSETTRVFTILFDEEVAGNIVGWEQSADMKVGFWLGKEFWGKGIASVALSQFLLQVKVRPLFAHVAKQNVGSVRVLQKCGFTICGEGEFDGIDGELGEEYILTLEE